MGSQGKLIINACQTQKHRHCHVISVTILRAQSSRTPGDLIFIIANEGGKMCSNTHFCNDWVYHRLGLKAWINNQKEAIGKTTISCDYWFSLRVSADTLIHRHEGAPGWMRLWDRVLWPCRTIVSGLVVCDGWDFHLCMKISLDKRFMFPSLQSQWNQVETCCINIGHGCLLGSDQPRQSVLFVGAGSHWDSGSDVNIVFRKWRAQPTVWK